MNKIDYSCAASLDFERSSYAIIGEGNQPVLVRVWCSVRQKPLTQFRLAGQFNRTLSNSGFFTSLAAVTTTTDSLLESAGCGVKTGWCMPLTASLAALVKRLHNLTTPKRQNGLSADKLTRSAHLARISSNAGGAGSQEPFCLFAPLMNCL